MCTVKLADILDIELLKAHLANGVVRRQVHPQYPQLFIYNYTEVAQYDRIWDNVTNVCRGLIIEGEADSGPGACDRVVARGFNKFHNLNTDYVPETQEASLPQGVVPVVTEKLDGSMGVMYHYDGRLWVATRGSFASDQARWATEWLRARETEDLRHYAMVGDDHTLVFEIIYRANRIVVDYDFEGLIITGCIDNATGDEVVREVLEQIGKDTGLPVVKQFTKTLAECAAENGSNEEGYVLTYHDRVPPLKLKVKFAEYVRLHRILTGLNPKAVWEMLMARQDQALLELLTDPKMPSGFVNWLGEWVQKLRRDYQYIEERARNQFLTRPFTGTWKNQPDADALRLVRKAQAGHFMKQKDTASICFAMLDGKDYSETIWKMIKPKATDTFKQDGE